MYTMIHTDTSDSDTQCVLTPTPSPMQSMTLHFHSDKLSVNTMALMPACTVMSYGVSQLQL